MLGRYLTFFQATEIFNHNGNDFLERCCFLLLILFFKLYLLLIILSLRNTSSSSAAPFTKVHTFSQVQVQV